MKAERLTFLQYLCLARLRNHMGVGRIHGATVNSLRRRKMLKEYDLEVTAKGNAAMDEYSRKSKAA